jgi:hypothetical protein
VKAGTNLKLSIDGMQIHFMKGKAEIIAIPTTAVTEVSTCRTYIVVSEPL